MQSVSSRIWTRGAVSISYDDNYYTTGTSMSVLLYVSTTLTQTLHFEKKSDGNYTGFFCANLN